MGALTPAEATAVLGRLKAAVCEVIRGKDEVVELALVAVVAGGHVLLQDVPGVGKTTLASALAATIGGEFRRVQFTSDLLPSDLTGVGILDQGAVRFRPGPLFANVVLADEINRGTPKVQSALLEAMNERRVTVDGVSHPLPQPFLVLATQNPHDFHGTYALPESQLDRFLLRLSMGYPDRASEREILRGGGSRKPVARAVTDPAEVAELALAAERVTVHPQVEDYLLSLVERTRADSRLIRGVSTRGAEALYRAVRALAIVRGRAFATPEDVAQLALPVLAHRVISRADDAGEGAATALREILWDLPAPG